MSYVGRYRGCLALTGPIVDEAASPFLSHSQSPPPLHITLLTKAELREVLDPPAAKTIGPVYALGVSRPRPDIVFVPVLWPEGQRYRLRLGLPPAQFHITLSAADAHDIDKSVDSILEGMCPSPAPDALLYELSHDFLLRGNTTRALQTACRLPHDSPRRWIRIGDVGVAESKYKLAMLAYGRALHDLQSVPERAVQYCLKRMFRCAQHTEWDVLYLDDERGQIPDDLAEDLEQQWPDALRDLIARSIPDGFLPTLSVESRVHVTLPDGYKLPRFFRWVVPFHLAAMSTPRNRDDCLRLAQIGVRHIVTLTEEEPLPTEWFGIGPAPTQTFLPVPNYMPPSPEQIDLFLAIVSERAPVLVHCGGGKGRAGTALACFMVAFGFQRPSPDWDHPVLPARQAIARLRAIRPGSIETTQQEAAVIAFESRLWKRRSALPVPISEPAPTTPIVTGDGSAIDQADLVVLVGLPGSGKSWFRQQVMLRDWNGDWEALSGDEMGRAACEQLIGRHRARGRRLILDRCNAGRDDRAQFLRLADTWATTPIAILFDYPADLCVWRAQRRPDHPTLPPGNRVRTAVAQHAKLFVEPALDEGFKAIVRVGSFDASRSLTRRFTGPAPIFKFPRTPHLLNLGAATSDDVVVQSSVTTAPGSTVVITEKVDGANLGFSLSPDGNVVVQNRSHYVTSASHAQFKKLGAFVHANREALHEVLGRDPSFPERFILFGEWMAAQHSIQYTALPQLFIAFDLYDRMTKAWMDRAGLEATLAGTGITLVPVLATRSDLPSEAELKSIIQTKSAFTDGRVEGVYIKVEKGGAVQYRAKVVRPDFISGNEHWTKGAIVYNSLVPQQ